MTDHNFRTGFSRDILIVEDEVSAAADLGKLLEAKGYKVSFERSGIDAVGRVLHVKGKVNVILMDIDMPGEMDGIDSLHKIQEKYPRIPVILVTDHSGNQVYRRRVAERGLKIAGWIDKPIWGDNKKKLLQLIEKETQTVLPEQIEDRSDSEKI